MHHSQNALRSLAPDATGAGVPDAPQLLSVAELSVTLGRLAGTPPLGETVVEMDAPMAAPVRAFLRERGRASGGWLNRGWSLPLGELDALAAVAAACDPQTARVFRHAGDGGAPRVWLLGGERREPPAHGRSA